MRGIFTQFLIHNFGESTRSQKIKNIHAPIHIDTHTFGIWSNHLTILVPEAISLPGVGISVGIRDWNKVEVLARGEIVTRCEDQTEKGAYEVFKEFVERVWFRLID